MQFIIYFNIFNYNLYLKYNLLISLVYLSELIIFMGLNFILPKNIFSWFPLLLPCLLAAGVATVAAAGGAAAFGGASGHLADNGVSSSVAKAINIYKLCGCQCISATGAAGVGTDAGGGRVAPHLRPRTSRRDGRRLINESIYEFPYLYVFFKRKLLFTGGFEPKVLLEVVVVL